MQPTRPPRRAPRHLPPISDAVAGPSTSTDWLSTSPRTQTGNRSPQTQCHAVWSYYHRGCFPSYADVFTPNTENKLESAENMLTNAEKQRSQGKETATTKEQRKKKKNLFSSSTTKKDNWEESLNAEPPTTPTSQAKEDEAVVAEYLDLNREFLAEYVIDCVPLNEIERWLTKKSRGYMNQVPVGIDAANAGLSSSRRRDIFLRILNHLQEGSKEREMVEELARFTKASVGADACLVFELNPEHPDVMEYFVLDDKPVQMLQADERQMILVREVVELCTTMRVARMQRPDDFPDTPQHLYQEWKRMIAHYILYLPVLGENGQVTHILELWRVKQPFYNIEEEIGSSCLMWGSLALHFYNLYLDKKRQRKMSDFLLEVVKAIFEEMVSLDQLIKRILEYAQRLVNADRASLFLVDYRNFELVSTVFDLSVEPGYKDVEKKEIRMPISRGIAGHVALSGETMNIPDAYSDYRFNREVDEKTGYKTVNILCMPIKVQGKVIGVVQMVNKRNANNFLQEDEGAFEIFSTFFGLALHHARLYDRIMRKEQKYKVALEVLSYHNTCRENEVEALLHDKERISVDLTDFYLDPFKCIEFEKCKAVVTMLNDLFDLSKFNIVTVTRFILTVKKNYRTVPYHNFDHGWSVAHCMYVILKNDIKKRYSYKVRLALFVACLCHDLDHRGYTNKYMSETASPLAAMYSTSTLEHHHFNITVTILQQDGHNIFSHFSSEDYKEILGYIRQCILATDLAAFFPNLAKMKELHEGENKFSWANTTHRDLAMAISMTAADLSAAAKPWEVQIKTVRVICEEFYDQGDKEREAGRTPIPMMDRNKPEEQPASQVGFLSQICIPCYRTLYRILPRTKPMFVMALRNLHRWTKKAERIRNNKNNAVEDDCTEDLAEISDEFLLKDEEALTEGEDEIPQDSIDNNNGKESVKINDMSSDNKPVIPWEEEENNSEESNNPEEKIGGRLSKDIEGVTWIDEEGVVVRPNGSLPTLVNNMKRK